MVLKKKYIFQLRLLEGKNVWDILHVSCQAYNLQSLTVEDYLPISHVLAILVIHVINRKNNEFLPVNSWMI